MLMEEIVDLSTLYNSGDLESVQKVEAYFLTIAKRIYPNHDWEKNPINFRLSEEPRVNARVYPSSLPPCIVVTKGTLAFAQSEDELAFVLAHELSHTEIIEKVGLAGGTKGEEFGADYLATIKLIDAKYRYGAGIDFFRRLQKQLDEQGKRSLFGDIAQAVFDPHPVGGNRIAALELGLSKETLFNRGRIELSEPKPLDPVVLQDLGAARHQPYIERIMPPDYDTLSPVQKLAFFQEEVGKVIESNGNDKVIELRLTQLCAALQNIVSDGSPEYLAKADEFIFMAERLDPYNTRYRFDKIYASVAKTIKNEAPLPALGPFRKLNEALSSFSKLDAEKDSEEEISRYARLVRTELGHIYLYFVQDEYSRENPNPRRSSIIRGTEISGYMQNVRVFYPLAKNRDAAELIWKLGGALDQNYWENLGPKAVAELKKVGSPIPDDGGPEKARSATGDWYEKIAAWEQQKRIEARGDAEPKTIPEYMENHEKDLFPPLSTLSAQMREGQYPQAEKFKAFVISAFKKATPTERDQLLKDLSGFYSACRSWRYGSGGRNLDIFDLSEDMFGLSEVNPDEPPRRPERPSLFSSSRDPIDLPEDHPYAQLLVAEELSLSLRSKIKNIDDVCELSSVGPELVRQLIERDLHTSVRPCLDEYFLLNAKPENPFGFFNIVGYEILHIFQSKPRLMMDDPDLLTLVKAFPNGEDKRRYYDSVISSDLKKELEKKLVMGSESGMSRLGPASLNDTLALYRFLERNNLFPTPTERSAMGNILLEKIKHADPDYERLAACQTVLFRARLKGGRYDDFVTANLALRDEVIKIWQAELVALHGLDDGSHTYKEDVSSVLNDILKSTVARDQRPILEALADGLEIQRPLSKVIREKLEPTKETLTKTHMPIAGVESLFQALQYDEGLRLALIDYLSEPQSEKSVRAMATAVKNGDLARALSEIHDRSGKFIAQQERRVDSALQDLHTHFTHLSVEERAAVLSILLVPGEDRLDEEKYDKSFRAALDLVMNKVFPKGSENADEARLMMTAYLHTAASHERMALLAGLLSVAVDSDPNVPASTAVQATRMMSALGPAYIKLLQAINSYPQSPADWKEATSGAKSSAPTDPRWELIRQIEECLRPSVLNQIDRIGSVMGSASFNTALKVRFKNGDGVVLLERHNAAVRAESGFDHLAEAVEECDSTVMTNYRRQFREVIDEARVMAREETSRDANDKQYANSQSTYDSKQVTVTEGSIKTIININPVDSLFVADGVRVLSEASGTHFSDLPETTGAELAFKRTVAKAYVALEMSNMLSGKPFDCDRHGKQLKVDVRPDGVVDLNLFDFGGMGTADPTKGQKQALGRAINEIASGVMKGEQPEAVIMAIIDKTVDPKEREYIMRTRKAWLALGDFMRYLDGQQDYVAVLQSAVAGGIDPKIKDNMPILGKLKFASLFSLGKPKLKIEIGRQKESAARHHLSFEQGAEQSESSRAPVRAVDREYFGGGLGLNRTRGYV